MKKILTLAVLATLITACGSSKIDSLDMQKMVAYKLGLASSDEVTITNVKEIEANSLGGKKVTLDAKTVRNKKYTCSYNVTPGLTPLHDPSVSNLVCKGK